MADADRQLHDRYPGALTGVAKPRVKHWRGGGETHLIRRHGWTLAQYRGACALLKGDASCARGTSQKLREHTAARLRTADLVPAPAYQKPLGSGGRGVRSSC